MSRTAYPVPPGDRGIAQSRPIQYDEYYHVLLKFLPLLENSMRIIDLKPGDDVARSSGRSGDPLFSRAIILGDKALLLDEGEQGTPASRTGGPAPGQGVGGAGNLFLVVQKGRLFQREFPDAKLVLDKGRYLVVELDPSQAALAGRGHEPCFVLEPLEPGRTVFEAHGHPAAPAGRRRADPVVEAVLAGLDEAAFLEAVRTLAGFRTRHSASGDFRQAAGWAEAELRRAGFETSLPEIPVPGGTSCNLVADRRGLGEDQQVVIVTAHLDSVNLEGGPNAPAPGADDDASGCAGALLLAGACARIDAAHDLRIVLFGGEEQGLLGSRRYVAGLDPAERRRIRSVVNMDMIGVVNGPEPTVLIEGAPVSRPLVDELVAAAALHTGLAVETSMAPYASDHVPFIEAGIPAVLTIEGADGANEAIHTARDTADRIDPGLAIEILRMNAAVVAGGLFSPVCRGEPEPEDGPDEPDQGAGK
jgi:hypothetical protein